MSHVPKSIGRSKGAERAESPIRVWLPLKKKPGVKMGEGPPAPRGSFRGRSPAGTCRHIHADRRARLRQTVLVPVHPLRSTRRSQGRGVSRPIALHAFQLLGPTVPYPDTSAVRSPGCLRIRLRIPPSLSWRNIGACRSPRPPDTRLVTRISRVDAYVARGQSSPSICLRNPERPVAARRESSF